MRILDRGKYMSIWDNLVLQKSMVFLVGPRQSGKTTLSKNISKNRTNSIYVNWDIFKDKETILKHPTFFTNLERKDSTKPIVILDEIHKYKSWKDYLKGVFDEFKDKYLFLILGSGRLDLYKQGGDSLAGRYFMFYLFPFTVAELAQKNRSFKDFIQKPLENFSINNPKDTYKIWERLSNVSGFPESYMQNSKEFWRVWSTNYIRQIIYEDIQDMADIRNTSTIAAMFSLLPSKIRSTISINNLASDVSVAFDTAKSWLNLFNLSYLTFEVLPWSHKLAGAIKKEKKIYLFNYPEIENNGGKFENMVAIELQRAVQIWNSLGYGRFSLHYIRNKQKEEVDFMLVNNNKPLLLIEAKVSDKKPSKSLIKFQNKLHIPAIQLVEQGDTFSYHENNEHTILIAPAHMWLSALPFK